MLLNLNAPVSTDLLKVCEQNDIPYKRKNAKAIRDIQGHASQSSAPFICPSCRKKYEERLAVPPMRRCACFKPSLTPGSGTRRVVGQDQTLRFGMDPSENNDEAFEEWRTAIRRMAALGDGLPAFVRHRVWSNLADHQLAKQHVDWDRTVRMAFRNRSNPEDEELEAQILKDLHRTGSVQFGSQEDKASLERVLLAYARWNKRVGYCQGFNVIAAGILDVMHRDEKEAFKIMVYLIDYVLPESYFAQSLQALSVDIAVFRHLLRVRLPNLAIHMDKLQGRDTGITEEDHSPSISTTNCIHCSTGLTQGLYEPPLMNVYIIQWFLTLFTTCLAPDAVLRVWDSILLEGSEILLRTAIVIMDFLASRLMKLNSADQFYGAMGDLMSDFAKGHIVSTREFLFEIYQMAPFPYPNLKELREKFTYNITPLVGTKLQDPRSMHFTHGKANTNEVAARRRFRFPLLWKRERQQLNGISEAVDPTKDPMEITATSPRASQGSTVVTNRIPSSGNYQYSRYLKCENDKSKSSDDRGQLEKIDNPMSSCLADDEPNSECTLTNSDSVRKRPSHTAHFTCYETGDAKQQSKKKGKDRSIGLQAVVSSESTDISIIGPGAVGESRGLKMGENLPSSHRARMSLTLKDLKALYRQQLIRQHRARLYLPGLWDRVSTSDLAETWAFSHSLITAVLPQKREMHQMPFTSSLTPNFSVHANADSNHSVGSVHGKVSCPDTASWVPSVQFGVCKRYLADTLSSSTSMESSSDFADSKKVDPILAGAVARWQAGAVWLCEPNADTYAESEEKQCNNSNGDNTHFVHASQPSIQPSVYMVKSTSSYSAVTLGIGNEEPRRSSFESTPLMSLHSYVGEELTHSQLTKRAFSTPTLSDDCKSIWCTPPGAPATSCVIPLLQSPKRICNSTTLNVSSTTPVKLMDNMKHTESGCIDCTYDATHSTQAVPPLISTPASSLSSRKLPWQIASEIFTLRAKPTRIHRLKSHIRNSLSGPGISLPISPTRRAFGAQFGMYKTLHPVEKGYPSTFCDRIHLVDILRHRQISPSHVTS